MWTLDNTQGIRFTNYAVQSQCTPTRSAILTGRMPVRTGNSRVPLPGEGKMGLTGNHACVNAELPATGRYRHYNRPNGYELPASATLRPMRDEHGGHQL